MFTATKSAADSPELNVVLLEFAQSVQVVLGGSFVAACLQGSLAVGDFDRCSDVDFVVAVQGELTGKQAEAVRTMHRRLYDLASPWSQRLEGSYFPVDTLRDWRRRGTPLWYLDNGARDLVRSDHCNTILVRWVVREMGISLAGAAPATLVDPIPVEELRNEIMHVIKHWGGEILENPGRYSNRFYQTYIVLNFSRMLHDLRNGYPGSKLAGAEWAVTHLDPRWAGLIERCWVGRQHSMNHVRYAADPEEWERTLAFLRYVRQVCESVAPARDYQT